MGQIKEKEFNGTDKVVLKFNSIEELYGWLYVEGQETLLERKEHEKLLRTYIERGFTQYEAMVNLVISNERVKKQSEKCYLYTM